MARARQYLPGPFGFVAGVCDAGIIAAHTQIKLSAAGLKEASDSTC
jgi:hypothetical protein